MSSRSSAVTFRFVPTVSGTRSSSHNAPSFGQADKSSSEGHLVSRSPRKLLIRDDTGDTGTLIDFCMGPFRHGCPAKLTSFCTRTPFAHLPEFGLHTLAYSSAVAGIVPGSLPALPSTGVRAPVGVSQYAITKCWPWLLPVAACAAAAAAASDGYGVHAGGKAPESHSGFTGNARGELMGGVTGALEGYKCNGGRPPLLLVLSVPLPPLVPKPFSHGMSDSLAPGYEFVGLVDSGGEVVVSACSPGRVMPCGQLG